MRWTAPELLQPAVPRAGLGGGRLSCLQAREEEKLKPGAQVLSGLSAEQSPIVSLQ